MVSGFAGTVVTGSASVDSCIVVVEVVASAESDTKIIFIFLIAVFSKEGLNCLLFRKRVESIFDSSLRKLVS